MAKSLRPRALAAGFGAYFVVIALASWVFATGTGVWSYDADSTRWIYTTYMLVAAIFLVGLGGLGLSIRRAIGRQIRELERPSGPTRPETYSDALPPPLPDSSGVRDNVDRDIDELLESLSEVEASAAREAEAMETAPVAVVAPAPQSAPQDVSLQRERLMRRQKMLGRFVLGPGLVAAVILGVSGMMLPGADGFAQTQFRLNTGLILGIGYSWLGVGGYIAATVYALASAREDRRKK